MYSHFKFNISKIDYSSLWYDFFFANDLNIISENQSGFRKGH